MRTSAKKLRGIGHNDYQCGKPIGAYYDVALSNLPHGRSHKRHTEMDRADYEIGWRSARDEVRAILNRK